MSTVKYTLLSHKHMLSLVLLRRFHAGCIKCCKNTGRTYLSRFNWLSPGKQSKDKVTSTNCKSHELFLNNEILYPCHSGVYHYLPLGLRSLEKLIRLIDGELQRIGAQKIAMPSLAQAQLWKKTERWDTPELFKLFDRHSKEYCLGPTHEELVTSMIAAQRIPHRRFPVKLYQITRKFRDEMRPKHALLRGREFEMKDMYTFDTSEEAAKQTYQLVCDTYSTIFNKLGLQYVKVAGDTGNIGGNLSHEYHLASSVGEDTLYVCNSCGFGTNSELVESRHIESGNVECPECKSLMKQSPGIEVGHAFLLGTKYSKALKSTFVNQMGKTEFTEMGCYGLGVSRILQASVEVLSPNTSHIRWPRVIAPYQVCIIPQKEGYMCEKFCELADSLSDTLHELPALSGEVVVDDRITYTVSRRLEQARGQGYPHCVVIGKKSLEEPAVFEYVDNYSGTTEFLTWDQLVDRLRSIHTV